MNNRAAMTAAMMIALATLAASAKAQNILQGPVVNPANGNTYYRLSQSNWNDAQAAARALGGNLVTINDAAENDFVRATFLAPTRDLWLGYHDPNRNGSFRWVSNQESDFVLWLPGEPNNIGNERFTEMRGFDATGVWNNTTNGGLADNQGIVEVERFSLEWNSIDGGARTATAGDLQFRGITGQCDALSTPIAAGTFELTGGFWATSLNPPPPPCPADFNGDGNTDPDDLSDYIACYFGQPPCAAADFNTDGNTDPDDLSDYIASFFAGCP